MLGPPAIGVLLAALGVVPGTAAAAAGPGTTPSATSAPAPALLPAGRTYRVTLLTGDVVSVRGTAAGCPVVSVDPATPSGTMTRSCGPDGHVRVVPSQVAPLLGDVLDPALFDVTAMIMDGYDDGRRKDLPLIVRPGGAAGRLAADPLVAGLAGSRTLPSIAAVSGRRSKATGAALIRTLSARSSSSRSATASPKVWLDRRVRATLAPGGPGRLDHNLRQIAAPRAWQAGYTGRGARVAVLDTGVDFHHPDLVGRIAERMDFSVDGGDAVDHFGHGTHVAATIAGTGQASGGARKGVAPDAQLLVGKVLNDEGDGTESQVIAGMEWASARADVVNMSLGGDGGDGTDPTSLALDALSKQTGALFVVAAGNVGPAGGTVGSPGTAATALTVGAVDGDDVVADFSSRGPLADSRAAKPELVAPGVDIVAARAAGTRMGQPVDARYTKASGTSMAAPHVAGAAAVLAQRHPDWRGDQLKAALVGAADPITGGDAYVSGAGRLDVARPLAGVTATEPVVQLGTFAFPQSGAVDAKLGWRNTGTEAASVALRVAVTDRHGVAAPAGSVSLSAGRLRLGAGAAGGATLHLDRAAFAARPGLYTAVVTARVGGGVATRTPVTFHVEPPSYDLTVETTAAPGTPQDADGSVGVTVVNLDDRSVYARYDGTDPGGTLSFRVPAGRYSVMAASLNEVNSALGGDPDVPVDADTSLLVDFARAERVTASVDGVATEAGSVGLMFVQHPRIGPGWTDFAFAWGDAARNGNVFALPNSGAEVGTFRTYAAFGLRAPGDGPSPYQYDLLRPFGNGIPADPTYRVTAAEQATLARIDQHFNRLDKPDAETRHLRYGFTPEGEFLNEYGTRPPAGDRTDYVSSGYAWLDEAFWDGIVTQEAPARYAPGSRQEKVWVRQPLRSDFFDEPAGSPSDCAPQPPARTSGNLHVELVTLTDQHGRFDCFPDDYDLPTKRRLTLQRDGRTVGEADHPFADFAVPRQTADYRLTFDLDTTPANMPVSTRVSTSWTFRSAGPRGTGSTALPLLAVDYALPLDTANHPVPGAATFAVRQAHGVRAQAIRSFSLSASLDGGATWQAVPVDRSGDTFRAARLPMPAAGQSVSLRVVAGGSAGSGIEQTIIDAYRAG